MQVIENILTKEEYKDLPGDVFLTKTVYDNLPNDKYTDFRRYFIKDYSEEYINSLQMDEDIGTAVINNNSFILSYHNPLKFIPDFVFFQSQENPLLFGIYWMNKNNQYQIILPNQTFIAPSKLTTKNNLKIILNEPITFISGQYKYLAIKLYNN